jgi:hypothetical protein
MLSACRSPQLIMEANEVKGERDDEDDMHEWHDM